MLIPSLIYRSIPHDPLSYPTNIAARPGAVSGLLLSKTASPVDAQA
jgi:hypothetical protein